MMAERIDEAQHGGAPDGHEGGTRRPPQGKRVDDHRMVEAEYTMRFERRQLRVSGGYEDCKTCWWIGQNTTAWMSGQLIPRERE